MALSLVPGIGPVSWRRLAETFGDAAAVFTRGEEELSAAEGIGRERARAILSFTAWREVDEILEQAAEAGLEVCVWGDGDYPAALADIPDPPPVLFRRGTLAALTAPAVAVVGTRNPTAYGLDATAHIVVPLAEAGITIVSGMARGIDGHAHRAALDAGGYTVAVLGCGADVVYPPEHRSLRDEIASRGLILSEFPPGTAPDPAHFPRRNRIISGLAAAVVVVEAGEKSGALITAAAALDQGRDVFAVPGSIFSRSSDGCRHLIGAGARPVGSALEILEGIVDRGGPRAEKKEGALPALETLGPDAGALWSTLSGEPVHADEITARLAWPPARAAAALLSLEIAGLVQKLPGNYYQKVYG